MDAVDPFDAVRSETDPQRRAAMAGELIQVYQQRAVELARLRRLAILELQRTRGLTSVDVAALLGRSKGRISQIKKDAPPPERAFFGIGPVTIAVPLREMPGRPLPVIASEDAQARDNLRDLLEGQLSFAVRPFGIPVGGQWEPAGDVVAICGPKSSPVTAAALEADPVLTFLPDPTGRWAIRSRQSGAVYDSPMDDHGTQPGSDVAYVGRLPVDGHNMLFIAGVHALGSVGAVDYLTRHLAELYETVREKRFSMVIGSRHEDGVVVSSEAIVAPCLHE